MYTAKKWIRSSYFLEENTVDIIISDVKMPRMSGLDLIKSLRERGVQSPLFCEWIRRFQNMYKRL